MITHTSSNHHYLPVVLLLLVPTVASGEDQKWFTKETKWHGFSQRHFRVGDADAYLVAPSSALPGNPWVWRARFPGYHDEMDVALVKRGFHLAYINVAGLFGNDVAMQRGEALWKFVTNDQGLAERPAMEGVSRGGLFVYHWALKHPDRVACIYCDTPVCDFTSWPGGKGEGIGSPAAWKQCLAAHGLSEAEALAFTQGPLQRSAELAKSGIPILHIVAENDRVVPPKENTYRLKNALAGHGHRLDVISVAKGTEKSNGHHFTHPEPMQVVDFIVKHASQRPE